MAITNKAIIAGRKNIADYKDAYKLLNDMMSNLEARYDDVYYITLKHPLKDPDAVTPREARRGLERINRILQYGKQASEVYTGPEDARELVMETRIDIPDITKSPELIAVTKPTTKASIIRAIPAKDVETLYSLNAELDDIMYRTDIYYKYYGEQELGWNMKLPEYKHRKLSVASPEKAKFNIKSWERRRKFELAHLPGEGSAASNRAWEERLDETISAYPDTFVPLMMALKRKAGLERLSRRFAAYYRKEYTGNTNGWKNFWYESSMNDDSSLPDFLEVLGMPKIYVDYLINLFDNHYYEDVDEYIANYIAKL